MSQSDAEHLETGGVEAPRLHEAATRLKEVRRRYVVDAGDGERFTQTEEHLDAIISDLDGWLKPGGTPVEIGDLDQRLAVLQEMIESVGFPGFARVIGSVRENLVRLVEDVDDDEEPPPPQRFEPPPADVANGSMAEFSVDEWELRAELERPQRSWGRPVWSTVIVGVVAVAAVLLLSRGDSVQDSTDQVSRVPLEEPEISEPITVPEPIATLDLAALAAEEEFSAERLAQVVREIDLGYDALDDQDIDRALQHLLAAAEIDRHDRRLAALAGSLIEALLNEADDAFDNEEWDRAADRIEVARQIARGLYFDPAAIDQVAQRHADLTRFEDITPEDVPAFSRAVGHAVRITQTNGEVIFGRLEAFQDTTVLLDVSSGVEGGGAQFAKEIPLGMIREMRVFEAEWPSEIVLGE